jgi:hypothetical protein
MIMQAFLLLEMSPVAAVFFLVLFLLWIVAETVEKSPRKQVFFPPGQVGK